MQTNLIRIDMEFLQRSAITISYKRPFVDWNNALFSNLLMHENMIGESKTYLINEIYNNADKVIKKHFKIIFEAELEGICNDEEEWPQKLTFKLFNEWFEYQLSDLVIDLSNKSLYS